MGVGFACCSVEHWYGCWVCMLLSIALMIIIIIPILFLAQACTTCLVLRLQVDRLAETKGMDYLDKEKAKRQAKQQAEQLYDQNYGNQDLGGGGGGNWDGVRDNYQQQYGDSYQHGGYY